MPFNSMENYQAGLK